MKQRGFLWRVSRPFLRSDPKPPRGKKKLPQGSVEAKSGRGAAGGLYNGFLNNNYWLRHGSTKASQVRVKWRQDLRQEGEQILLLGYIVLRQSIHGCKKSASAASLCYQEKK